MAHRPEANPKWGFSPPPFRGWAAAARPPLVGRPCRRPSAWLARSCLADVCRTLAGKRSSASGSEYARPGTLKRLKPSAISLTPGDRLGVRHLRRAMGHGPAVSIEQTGIFTGARGQNHCSGFLLGTHGGSRNRRVVESGRWRRLLNAHVPALSQRAKEKRVPDRRSLRRQRHALDHPCVALRDESGPGCDMQICR